MNPRTPDLLQEAITAEVLCRSEKASFEISHPDKNIAWIRVTTIAWILVGNTIQVEGTIYLLIAHPRLSFNRDLYEQQQSCPPTPELQQRPI
jgi:hypothetical protein